MAFRCRAYLADYAASRGTERKLPKLWSLHRQSRVAVPEYPHCPLLPLLCAQKIYQNWRAAFRTLPTRRPHRSGPTKGHIALVDVVLGVPAAGALDSHPHDQRNPAVYAGIVMQLAADVTSPFPLDSDFLN